MRDLLLPMTPVAALVYFVMYPDQMYALIGWAGHYLH
jgi:hypothetical protein